MILAADIGGTKTNLALFQTEASEHGLGKMAVRRSFHSGAYATLEDIIAEFLRALDLPVTAAGFGIAGPIVDGEVRTPNLAWVVAAETLAKQLKLPQVSMINDLEANAFGIQALTEDKFFTLNPGQRVRDATRALISAGTGLGMAGLFWDGRHYRPLASEGGHMDLAPRNETEIELFRYLSRKFGSHVSYERVLSGPGLYNIYSFFRDRDPQMEEPWLAQEMEVGDKPAAISNAGVSGRSPLATLAVAQFCSFYGAAAGNLALTLKSIGGVYVGGGIAPKMLDKLKDGTFMRAFHDKGRLSSLLQGMPVKVILDDQTALYGAAISAMQQAA